jgi:thioredoxin reductase (NADPH)
VIAIIGAGPAGISAAVEAKSFGFENITIFEKTEAQNATIRLFYKDNKRVDKAWMGRILEPEGSVSFEDCSKEEAMDYFNWLVANEQIAVKYGEEVERIVSNNGRFMIHTNKSDYEASHIIVAIGCMGKPNRPSYKIPSEIRSQVDFNLDRVRDGESVLVVGGGNSAAEYAIDLSDICDVALSYRKIIFTRLNSINLHDLNSASGSGRLRLLLGGNITELQAYNSMVKVVFDNSEPELFDRVIYAIGGTTPVDFLKKCGIELNSNNQPILSEDFETTTKNMFVSGDLGYTGNGSIVAALNSSYKVLTTIDKRY